MRRVFLDDRLRWGGLDVMGMEPNGDECGMRESGSTGRTMLIE